MQQLSNNSYAVALYDNEAESEDELTFKKSDVLHVLHVDYMDMEGWCLCKLVKSGQTGLAAGNRLRAVQQNDKRSLLSKLKTESSASSSRKNIDQVDSRSACSSQNTTSIISISSSTCSISSSSSNSFYSNNNSSRLTQSNSADTKSDTKSQLSIEAAPLLPPKKRGESKEISVKKKVMVVNDDEYDDYYDYAVPRNNQPIQKEEQVTESSSLSSSSSLQRKSLTSTIDSGISTSSLVSLAAYSSHNLNSFEVRGGGGGGSPLTSKSSSLVIDKDYSNRSSSSSSSSSSSTTESNSIQSTSHQMEMAKRVEFEADFRLKLTRLKTLASEYSTTTKRSHKEHNFLLKFMFNFLTFNLKQVKSEHACFHPNLNVYNRFKSLYSDMKQFYACYDKWVNNHKSDEDEESRSSSSVCFVKLVELVDNLSKLIDETSLFEYHSHTSIEVLRRQQQSDKAECGGVEQKEETKEEEETYDNYQYVYDNLSGEEEDSHDQETYDNNNDYSDYCEIGELKKEEDELSSIPVVSQTIQQQHESFEDKTLTKNSTTSTTVCRLNMSDLMLLRFYLKHVDEYLSEMREIYNSDESQCGVGGNKLSLYGHKLVFICDTLERNLSNNSTSNNEEGVVVSKLKHSLASLSSLLSETLKVYAVRIKQLDEGALDDELVSQIGQSMHEMLNKSSQIRQLIVRHI